MAVVFLNEDLHALFLTLYFDTLQFWQLENDHFDVDTSFVRLILLNIYANMQCVITNWLLDLASYDHFMLIYFYQT